MTVHRRGPVLARLERPAGPATTLAVIADAHVTPHAAGTWKVFHRAEERLQAAIADANRLAVDGVALLGDLTEGGTPEELTRVDRTLQRSRAPVVGVPGNHDVSGGSIEQFVETYTPGTLPYRRRIGGVEFIGVNSASLADGTPTGGGGAVSSDQLDWLETALADAETPVVALHHPPVDVARGIDELPANDRYRLTNATAFAEVLRTHDVPLVFSGHLHWPIADRFEDVVQVVAPATCSFPQAYLLVHVEPRGTTISMPPLAGRAGIEEAYRYASRGGRRGRGLLRSTERGYFEELPAIDEHDGSLDRERWGSEPTALRIGR